jgi:hypothetical protein
MIGGHIVDAMDYIDNKILIFLLLRQWDNKDSYINKDIKEINKLTRDRFKRIHTTHILDCW